MAKIAKFRSVEARRNSETGKFKGPKLLEPPSVKTWGRLLIPAPPKPCILRCFHYVKRPTTISPLLAGLLSLYIFRKKKKKKKELRNSIAKEYFATRANLEGENRTDRFLEIFFFRSTGRYKVVINDFVCLYECNVRGETFKFSLSRIWILYKYV